MTISDDLIKITEAKKGNKAVWKKNVLNKELKPKFPELRKELRDNFYRSKPLALQKIAAMDGMLSLPVIIRIIADLQLINEDRLRTLYLTLTGTQLLTVDASLQDGEKEGLDRIFKPILKNDIGNIFREFIEDEIDGLEQLSEEAVNKKVEGVIEKFCANTIDKVKKAGDPTSAAKGREEFCKLLRNEVVIACAYKAYMGADEKQCMASNWDKGVFIAKYNAVKLKKPFLALVHLYKRISVTDESNPLWLELSCWLEGLYQRVYMMIKPECKDDNGVVKKDEKGYYPRVDKEDDDLFNNVRGGITKYDLSLYHQEAVDVIKRLCLPIQFSPQDLAPIEDEFDQPIMIYEEGKRSDGSIKWSFYTKPGHEAAMHSFIGNMAQATEAGVDVGTQTDRLVSLDLENFLKTPECKWLMDKITIERGIIRDEAVKQLNDMKINKLEKSINSYSLSEKQCAALLYISAKTPVLCHAYAHERSWKVLGWTVMRAWHAEDAEKLSREMSKSPANGSASEIKKQLNALFDLRRKLKDDSSQNLILSVNTLLVDAFDFLHKLGLPKAQEERKMSVRSA